MSDILNYTLFTIGGDIPVLLIDLVTSLFGLTCVILAGRNSKYNFWVGYVYTFLLFFMFLNKHLYANLLLQPISLCINILGHYRWTHPRRDEESSEQHGQLKVTSLSWPQRGICIVSIFIIAGAWGWLLSFLGNHFASFPSDPVPYLDSCVTVLILVSQFLSAQKKWDCWIGWLVVNVAQMIMHIKVGHVFMPIICGIYIINGIVSLYHWAKLYSRKA
ncbi:MAG: nicotinamide riboside transporter PnuC [Bacteroidales bacterium]|nr:nicotinamide riboside transporter PnuC [Bacteroidales bacterium]